MTSVDSIPIRRATPADAASILPLINSAGEGIPLHLWCGLAAPDEDPWDVAARRWAEKIKEIDVGVVDFGEGPVACLVGYRLGDSPTEIGPHTPAMFRPPLELENLALGSWYINMLATDAAYRGRGLGAALLQRAEDQARRDGCDRLSLIVADRKAPARRLYERAGFVEAARRPLVEAEGWSSESSVWILMIRML